MSEIQFIETNSLKNKNLAEVKRFPCDYHTIINNDTTVEETRKTNSTKLSEFLKYKCNFQVYISTIHQILKL